MLMALGMFVFELATAPYQELVERIEWRHGSTARFGARPATQFLGPGDEKITLSGCLVPPVTGGQTALRALRAMGDEGREWPMVDGTGRVLGNFIVESMDARKTHFLDNGVPRKTDFTIELRRTS